jgi:tetratricopeptide (TPR) repeat protein
MPSQGKNTSDDEELEGKNEPKDKNIEIHNSRGFVIGDFATVINNINHFIDEKILKRLGLEQRIFFVILLVAVIGMGMGLYLALRPRQPKTMSGDFRIAVASFYEKGKSPEKELGYDLADSVRLRLEQDLREINPELVITVWGPDQVGSISGDTAEQRAQAAAKIASSINADMVVYGVVDVSSDPWKVVPEFFIAADNFYEAREIVGQNDLGTPIELPGASNTAARYEFGKQMFARGKALSLMSVGLGYFALHEYESALETFQKGLDIDGWQDDQGKKVLYIMTGFAASKVGEGMAQKQSLEEAAKYFDLGQQYLQSAVSIDPEYTRPYIGLANLSYLLALQPSNKSKKLADIDVALLQDCYRYLDHAEAASNKPPLADAETKIHFARGQCSMMEVLSGHARDLAPAIHEFEQVIADYGDGANPRIQELAAEAHARLALIARETGDNETAAGEYGTAASLLSKYPDRQKVFLARQKDVLYKSTPTP